jgi:Spy/CpxP family protein refolding chaperone
MKFSRKIAIGAAAALGLAAAVVIAQPGQMGGAMGMHGPMAGMQNGPMGGMGQGPMGGQQLMTPEERSAFQEKMRNAKTPEERQKIAESQRAEMHKRATERGVAPKAPADPESSK